MRQTKLINRKSLWNAVYRCRDDGYLLDSNRRIVYLTADDFTYWKSAGMNPAARLLQWKYNYRIILKKDLVN